MPRAADASRGAEGLEILSSASVMRVSREVAFHGTRARIAEGPFSNTCAGAIQRIEALAIDEANVCCQSQAVRVGTRRCSCLRVALERV